MENEITVASFKEAAKGPDGPEKVAELIVKLVRDRDAWKELLRSAEAHIEQDLKIQADALKRVNAEQLARIEELDDQVLEMKLTFEQDRLSWFASAMKHKDKIRELETENQKLRGAVVQAPIPWVSGHVCSRECTHD